MGKEIILPWSCKAQNKFYKIVGCIALIGFPILLSYSIYGTFINYNDMSPLFLIGFLGTFMAWLSIPKLIDIEFPTFKCKTESESG